MIVLPTGPLVALIVVAVVIVLILVILLICCLCKRCDQCARWSRRTAFKREDETHNQQIADNRREFDELRQEHDTVRDQIRAKYNLNNDNSNMVNSA